MRLVWNDRRASTSTLAVGVRRDLALRAARQSDHHCRVERQRSREPHCGRNPAQGATARYRVETKSATGRRVRAVEKTPSGAQMHGGPSALPHRAPFLYRDVGSSRFVFWLPKRNPVRTPPDLSGDDDLSDLYPTCGLEAGKIGP